MTGKQLSPEKLPSSFIFMFFDKFLQFMMNMMSVGLINRNVKDGMLLNAILNKL